MKAFLCCLLLLTDMHMIAGQYAVEVRFPLPVSGHNYIQGHVEIKYDDTWGTICDDRFGEKEATVLCRMMGHNSGMFHSEFRQKSVKKSSKIWLDNVSCKGDETTIEKCQHNKWGEHNCDHDEDVAVQCSNTTTEGLSAVAFPSPVWGDNYVQGNVKIKYNGKWGTICDNGLSLEKEATVLCRMMGHKYGLFNRKYRQRSVKKSWKRWLVDVSCDGNETTIENCEHKPWGEKSENCQHYHDIAIKCSNTTIEKKRLLALKSARKCRFPLVCRRY